MKSTQSAAASNAFDSTLKRNCLSFVVLTILLNIAWPLTHGDARSVVTVLGVFTFTAVSGLHSWVNFGPRVTARLLATVMMMTFAIEFVGVHTGLPFGHYTYGDMLGPVIVGVPVIIPLAWFMMIYPSVIAAQFLARSTPAQVLVVATLMTGWDFYLDPQMTSENYWTWVHTGVEVNAIPLTNYAGWFISSALIGWLALRIIATIEPQWTHTIPMVMLMWTWLGGALAHAVWFSPFLNRPHVALVGFVSMGFAMVPLSRKILEARYHA